MELVEYKFFTDIWELMSPSFFLSLLLNFKIIKNKTRKIKIKTEISSAVILKKFKKS